MIFRPVCGPLRTKEDLERERTEMDEVYLKYFLILLFIWSTKKPLSSFVSVAKHLSTVFAILSRRKNSILIFLKKYKSLVTFLEKIDSRYYLYVFIFIKVILFFVVALVYTLYVKVNLASSNKLSTGHFNYKYFEKLILLKLKNFKKYEKILKTRKIGLGKIFLLCIIFLIRITNKPIEEPQDKTYTNKFDFRQTTLLIHKNRNDITTVKISPFVSSSSLRPRPWQTIADKHKSSSLCIRQQFSLVEMRDHSN